MIVFALLLTGCVIIPYRPASETKHDLTQVPNPERIRLTLGPRTFLEKLAKDTMKQDPRLTQFDAQTFIDTASPDGDLTLAQLLNPSSRARIEPLQVDYLVVLREPKDETIEDKGGMIFYLGFFGLQETKRSTTDLAAVIDLRELRLVEQLTSKATGTDTGAGIFYGLFIVSDTHGASRSGIIRHLVETIAKARPVGPVRLVFLAEERLPTPEEIAKQERRRRKPPPPSWSAARYPAFVESAPPREDQGLVYFYRRHRQYGALRSFGLHVNHSAPVQVDTVVTNLLDGSYYPVYVPAGKLNAWVESDNKRFLVAVLVSSGQTYYIRLRPTMGWRAPRAEMTIVDRKRAMEDMKECRLLPSAGEIAQETKRLAEDGWAQQQVELAAWYVSGAIYPDGRESLSRDYIEAYKWLTIASREEMWRKSARMARDLLLPEMNSAQIAEAARRASEWQAANPPVVRQQ